MALPRIPPRNKVAAPKAPFAIGDADFDVIVVGIRDLLADFRREWNYVHIEFNLWICGISDESRVM